MKSIAIAITVFRNPGRLASLLDNMKWSGLPPVPVYVFEDPSPFGDHDNVSMDYAKACIGKGVSGIYTSPEWGCMQGIIDYALANTKEDWIIYVPDDVIFPKGGLWNEYGGILTYGFDFVGGIQAPYWNASDLVTMNVMPSRDSMYNGWEPIHIPQNPHWNGPEGIPRAYINLNGAGFSINRKLYETMGGWPKCTWRLDEYAGYMAWKLGQAIITLPGPPRIHYFGGATHLQPEHGHAFHSEEAWKEATGGIPSETGMETREIMHRMKSESWEHVCEYFNGLVEGNGQS